MTAPMPSLHFYTNDIDDLIRAIEDRGVHPTETDVIVRAMKDLLAEAEELADLHDELDRAKDRIADLEIRLHDARRKVR